MGIINRVIIGISILLFIVFSNNSCKKPELYSNRIEGIWEVTNVLESIIVDSQIVSEINYDIKFLPYKTSKFELNRISSEINNQKQKLQDGFKTTITDINLGQQKTYKINTWCVNEKIYPKDQKNQDTIGIIKFYYLNIDLTKKDSILNLGEIFSIMRLELGKMEWLEYASDKVSKIDTIRKWHLKRI